MNRRHIDILIAGGGPAGMAAALAVAECGRSVTVVDDNPRLGGQIWRAELGKTRSTRAAKLIDKIAAGSIELVNGAQIFARPGNKVLAAETGRGPEEYEFSKLILATGARELFLPFPGWTLAGVFGAGGIQALVKGGLTVHGKRVVVAGTGPLLPAVADYLRSKGAAITAIVEQAPAAQINRFAFGLWRSPSKLFQAAAIRAKLLGVPYLTDSWITKVDQKEPSTWDSELIGGSAAGPVKTVTLSANGRTKVVECDYVACGFNLVPSTELAQLIGCRIEKGFVAVDEFQETSVPDIFCAGEPTGIGGVDAALIEGRIAGYAAGGDNGKAEKLFPSRDRAARFTSAIDRVFALRNELKSLAADTTIVCRCEDVKYGSLKNFESWRTAKLQTRCGMGPCQGRVCGAAAESIFGWTIDSPRPPIFPVKLENL